MVMDAEPATRHAIVSGDPPHSEMTLDYLYLAISTIFV